MRNLVSITCLLLLMSTLSLAFLQPRGQERKLFEISTHAKRLDDVYRIETVFVSSQNFCALSCKSNSICKSFNFCEVNRLYKKCQLSNNDADTVGNVALIADPMCKYFAVTVG